MEFSLNVFTKFAEFSDKKKLKNQKGRLQDCNPGSPVWETETLPLSHRDTGNRADPYTEPNSCLSDFSDSLNSLNSLNVLLHLEKTPVNLPQANTKIYSQIQYNLRGYTLSVQFDGQREKNSVELSESFFQKCLFSKFCLLLYDLLRNH